MRKIIAIAFVAMLASCGQEAAPVATDSIEIGCWNLEHFHDGMTRGFPECTHSPPGPKYPPRSTHDFEKIAGVITSLNIKILVLEEIHAESATGPSKEMDRLIAILGSDHYSYIMGKSGGAQHVAILFDRRFVHLNTWKECDFKHLKVDGKDLFEREPIIAHFRLLRDGKDMNDLAVIGVHLSAGQEHADNHDRAMEALQKEIRQLRGDNLEIPRKENDIVIMGDFNCNRFDKKTGSFWNTMESHGWAVLAQNKDTYPVTRLSGVPLKPRDSRIDYIIVTKGNHGLQGEEIVATEAKVHTELLGDGSQKACEAFRRFASDHLPVTVTVKVMEDTDK